MGLALPSLLLPGLINSLFVKESNLEIWELNWLIYQVLSVKSQVFDHQSSPITTTNTSETYRTNIWYSGCIILITDTVHTQYISLSFCVPRENHIRDNLHTCVCKESLAVPTDNESLHQVPLEKYYHHSGFLTKSCFCFLYFTFTTTSNSAESRDNIHCSAFTKDMHI